MHVRLAVIALALLVFPLTIFATEDELLDRSLRTFVSDYHVAVAKQDLPLMRQYWDPGSPYYNPYFESVSKQFNEQKGKTVGVPIVTSTHLWSNIPRVRFEINMDGKLQRLTIQFLKVGEVWKVGRILDSVWDVAYHLGRLLNPNDQKRLLEDSPEMKTPETLESVQYHLFELTNRSEFESGLNLANFGIEVAREIKDNPHLGRIMIRRSTIFEQSGEYAKATEALLAAIDFSRTIGDRQMEGLSMYYMARVLGIQGDKAAARDYLNQAAAHAEIVKNITLTNQVLNLQALNMPDPKDRLAINNRLLANVRERGNRYGEAGVLGNIAQCYSDLGNQEKAIELMTEALRIFMEIGMVGEPPIARIAISDFHDRAGRLPEALQWAEQTLDLAESGNIDAQRHLFKLYYKLGRKADARRMAEASVALNEASREKVISDDVVQAKFLQERAIDYQNLIQILSETGTPLEALKAAEIFKARALFDVLNAGKVRPPLMLSPPERQLQDDLTQRLSMANQRLMVERQREFPSETMKVQAGAAVEKARSALKEFRLRLYAEKPELKLARANFQPAELDELKRLVPNERTALLEFAITDNRSFGYLITGRAEKLNIQVFPIEISRTDLYNRVQAFRSKLQTADLNYLEDSNLLFGLLLAPIHEKLRNVDSLIIAPDSFLWDVPFQALRPKGGRFLIETHSVGYAPSLTALLEMKKLAQPGLEPNSILAFANPNVGESQQIVANKLRGERLGQLLSAEYEVDAIAKIIGPKKSVIYLREKATESVFRDLAPESNILHFATHGILNAHDPMYSSIVLSASDAKDDGLLEAWEIMAMRLSADLAVLSACETGRGHSAGEGIVGLSWAFFVAGVPRVVASQWKVESQSTAQLMKEFYKSLKANPNPSVPKSLRNAILSQLKSGKQKHPFYWAGFIAIGS